MATSGYEGDNDETDRRISNREIGERKKKIIAKEAKRTKKTRKSKKSRKRIKSKKNRKSKKNNKSRKRKRISKMPMELPGELKTTGGFGEPGKRWIPRSMTKGFYRNILQPIRRGTDRVGLTHYYQQQPQYQYPEEY